MQATNGSDVPHHRKRLGLWTCTALVVGNMIGSGIFLLPAALAPYGAISMLGWLFSAAGAIVVALVFARLSRLVPRAGGPYAYSRRAYGEFAGFLIAWGYWISIIAGNAAISVAMVGYLGVFWPALAHNKVIAATAATLCIWTLTLVNSLGVRNAGDVQVVTTVLKLIPLIAIGTLGFIFFDPGHFTPFNASGESTLSALAAAATLTLWAFVGLESATIPAGDVDNPQRTIARATLIGTVIAAVVYILATAAVMGMVPPGELGASTAPFSEAAQRMLGPWAGYAVAAGAAVSCFGALNGWILNSGQIPMAAARDGVFPAFLARTGSRGTPVPALVVSSVLVTLLMAANYTRGLVELFQFAILLATLTTLIAYLLSSLAEILIMVREPERFAGKRPHGVVALAVPAFLFSLWAIGGAGRDTVYWGFLLLLAGVPLYVWLAWQRRGQPRAAD